VSGGSPWPLNGGPGRGAARVAAVTVGTLLLIEYAPRLRLDEALFESVSALPTVGLSMTPTLPPPARVVLIVLMFVGRVAPSPPPPRSR
jgi:Trk-type K+ transport system membrane component